MKKLLTIAFVLILFGCQETQNKSVDDSNTVGITIEPSKGDRFSYFLNGDVWETSLSLKSEFALKKFVSDDYSNTWILNLSMNEIEFIKLMEYLSDLPYVNVGGKTMLSSTGKDNWVLDSFDIYGSDYYEKPIGKGTPPDLEYVMKMIKLYFKIK